MRALSSLHLLQDPYDDVLDVSLFLDGKMLQTYNATEQDGITGAMSLGGNGFKGNIDEFVIFEQALPKSLIDLYEDNALTGDEMGLFAYLPFEEQYTNPNGIIEQRFSVNDRRIFKDANGNVVNKVVPLVTTSDQRPMTDLADAANNAPIKSHGILNKLYFDWSFNNDELMINILNRDYEVNKQSVYVTVRDVEDLNGNPMSSPVSWTAFVDRNSLKWSDKTVTVTVEDQYNNTTIQQYNNTTIQQYNNYPSSITPANAISSVSSPCHLGSPWTRPTVPSIRWESREFV